MATFTINVPDDKLGVLLSALEARYGPPPEDTTRGVWGRECLRRLLGEVVFRYNKVRLRQQLEDEIRQETENTGISISNTPK